MKNILLLLVLIAFVAVTADAADDFVANELLVSFHSAARGALGERIRNSIGVAKIKEWQEINAEHWRLPPGLAVAKAIEALSANPNVAYAEPDYILQASDFPNDPYRASLVSFHNVGQGTESTPTGTVDADIDAAEAWGIRHDAGSIVVAVLDSGIDVTHPDLAPNLWRNLGETGTDAHGADKATNGIDDDGNGYVDDVYGWNFISNNNNPFDDNGHGTHVSGTIGAVGNKESAWRVPPGPSSSCP